MIRDALSKHLIDVSKKLLKKGPSRKNNWKFPLLSSWWRSQTIWVYNPYHLAGWNTGCDLYTPLNASEFYRTTGFKEIAMIYGDTKKSYRKQRCWSIIFGTKRMTAHLTGRLNTLLKKKGQSYLITLKKIKTLQRQAYGFRDAELFKLKIYGLYETKYALVGWTQNKKFFDFQFTFNYALFYWI